jgi:hypothetical protein
MTAKTTSTTNTTPATAPAPTAFDLAGIPDDLLRLAELLMAASREARRKLNRHPEIAQSIGTWETARHSVGWSLISNAAPALSAAEVARLQVILEAAQQGIKDYAIEPVDEDQ